MPDSTLADQWGRYTGTAGFEAVPPDICSVLGTYGEYSGTNFQWRPYYKIDSRYDPLDITLHQRDVWGSDSKPPPARATCGSVPCDKSGPDPHNGGAVLWQYQPICKRKDLAAPPVPQVVALSSNPNDVLRTQCANDNMIEVGQVKIGYGGYHMARACAGLIAADERCSADFHYFFDGLCACVPKGETCDVNDSAPNNRMAFRIVPGTLYEPASPPPPTPQQNYCRSKPSDAREAGPWCLRTTFPAWLDGRFDTPLWTNGITDGDTTHGAATCEFYVFKEWCANGALLDPTYGGEAYNFPEQNLLRVRQERRRRRVARRRRRRADDRAVVRVLRRPRALVLHGGGGERPRPRRPTTRAARRPRRGTRWNPSR